MQPTGTPKNAAGVEYTCPMHPQIRQMGPGNCPICGMTPEPVVVTAEAGTSPELRDMTRRFWVGLALSAPVVFSKWAAASSTCTASSVSRCRTGSSCCSPRWCSD